MEQLIRIFIRTLGAAEYIQYNRFKTILIMELHLRAIEDVTCHI